MTAPFSKINGMKRTGQALGSGKTGVSRPWPGCLRTPFCYITILCTLGYAEIQMQVQMWSLVYKTPLPNGSSN